MTYKINNKSLVVNHRYMMRKAAWFHCEFNMFNLPNIIYGCVVMVSNSTKKHEYWVLFQPQLYLDKVQGQEVKSFLHYIRVIY